MSDVLSADNIQKTYSQGESRLDVLKDVTLSLKQGEIVALIGHSGSGKSTLLHCLGLLDRPSGGSLMVSGQDVSRLNDQARTALRRSALGFVYQFHYLQPEFTALENVMLPLMIAGENKSKSKKQAADLLELVGLGERMDHRPARLSGGEQQRVAIARALANQPKIILADEPTGNLDEQTADQIFDIFMRAVKERGVSALIATHNRQLAERMDRQLILEKGVLK